MVQIMIILGRNEGNRKEMSEWNQKECGEVEMLEGEEMGKVS
jgi:hypothetical protein